MTVLCPDAQLVSQVKPQQQSLGGGGAQPGSSVTGPSPIGPGQSSIGHPSACLQGALSPPPYNSTGQPSHINYQVVQISNHQVCCLLFIAVANYFFIFHYDFIFVSFFIRALSIHITAHCKTFIHVYYYTLHMNGRTFCMTIIDYYIFFNNWYFNVCLV